MKNFRETLNKISIAAALSLCLALATGCGFPAIHDTDVAAAAPEEAETVIHENVGFVMGTVANITVYTTDDDISGELIDAISDLETRYLSCKLQDSEIAAINANAAAGKPTEVSDRMKEYIVNALSIARNSDGAFDPTIGHLSALWDFDSGKNTVPNSEDIEALLKDVGYGHLVVKGNTVALDSGAMVDMGAIGKGIACDEIESFLSDVDAVTGALINIGGSSTVTYGNKSSGAPWKVAVLDPRNDAGFLGVLSLEGTNHVSTSADYEKYFIKDGKRYCHILDPSTGYPAARGLISATVIADSGAVSDSLSTACFVSGKDKAMELLEEHGAEGILVDSEMNVYITEGLTDFFEIKAEGYRIAGE